MKFAKRHGHEKFGSSIKVNGIGDVVPWIVARGNFPVYCNKAAGIDMQNHAVAGVKQHRTC